MSRDFYRTKAWKEQSKLYALSKQCICELCHRPVYVSGITPYLPKEKRLGYVIHHKIHLTDANINDDSITLNWDNLQLLCTDCHARVHGDSPVREDVCFDENGNLVKRKVLMESAGH